MEEHNKQNQNEIELDKNSNKEIQLDINHPDMFDTYRQQNLENNPSNQNENNEEIIIVEEESNLGDRVKNKPIHNFDREKIIFAKENNFDQVNKNIPQDKHFMNISINQNNNLRSPGNPSNNKQNSKNKFLFFEDIYKDILFFFINPIAGSHDGQLLIDMGVKKVEFLDNMKSSAYSAYIFNILDQANYQQGIALLKDYQERGNDKQ